MFKQLGNALTWLGAVCLLALSQIASAATIPIGLLTYGTTSLTTAQFGIVNLTGSNVLPGFPVVTPITISGLQMLVTFSDASQLSFAQADFVLSLDGLSYDGPTVAIGGVALPVAAQLTGLLSPTSILVGTTPTSISSAFVPTSLVGVGGAALDDEEVAVIYATDEVPAEVPAPGSASLLLIGGAGLLLSRHMLRRTALLALALPLALASGAASAVTLVKLATAATPSSAVVSNFTKVVASGLPAVAPGAVAVAIAPTCAATGPVAGQVDTVGIAITPVPGGGGIVQLKFQVPAGLSQGTYFVSISGVATSDTFASTNCSVLTVTTSNIALNSCLPTSSLAVALGPTVRAYVPNGSWSFGDTGIEVVTVEGSAANQSIATPGVVNSCSANPATGQAICTANSNDVYLVSGATLTNTLTSGATGFANFSGGRCRNCGVAVNGLTNTAYIAVGLAGSPSGSGIQALNLATNTFDAPFPLRHIVSENISVDAGRNLLLTAGEDNNYGLVRLGGSGRLLAELENTTIAGGGLFDASASDCTTGIALASNEFTSNIALADLNQISYPTIDSWNSPSAVVPIAGAFSEGVSGIAVAPGSSHMGIATGEFGGQSFVVFELPSTPATTPPALKDYAYVATMPNTPNGRPFAAGFDPHTITAYASPNNGRVYGVIAGWDGVTPSFLAVIDLKKIQNAPRHANTNTVDTGAFDLLATGAIRYVPVP